MSEKYSLIIDVDESTLNRLEKNILAPSGHIITTTSRAEKIPSGSFDLIFLGDRSGDNPLDRIEPLIAAHPASPIILITHRNRSGALTLQALEKGASACLSAPIHVEEVLAAVSQGLTRRRQLLQWAGKYDQAASSDTELSHLRKMMRVTQLGRSVTSMLDLDEVLSAVVKAAVEVTGAEEGNLMLLDHSSGALETRASYNFEEDSAQMLRQSIHDSLARQVLESMQPMLVDKETPEQIRTEYLVHSLIYVPLVLNNEPVGILGVDNRKHRRSAFTRAHIAILEALADFAVIAIENARLFAQVEMERIKAEGMVMNVADGVIVIDERGCIILINDTAREIFGLKDTVYTGQPVDEAIDCPDLTTSIIDPNQAGLRRLELEPENGQHYIAQINLLPGVGKTVTLQNVTHFKELDRVKNDFVTAISHDLRSPLTAVLGYIELIGRVGETNPQQQEFISRIQASVRSITNLINDLLELGRIEADFDQSKVAVPFPVILQYAADGLKNQFSEKDQEFVLDIEEDLPEIFGSPIRLRQLVTNLIENAHKYTPPGGKVIVKAESEGPQVILHVIDNGIGIPPSDLPYIFDKLYRASNISLETPGTGLGLSIVRSIAKNHGGRLWCESKVGKGSTFTVVLPCIESD